MNALVEQINVLQSGCLRCVAGLRCKQILGRSPGDGKRHQTQSDQS